MLIVGFFIPAMTLVIQGVRPRWFNLTRTVVASAFIVIAFWVKRFLIVVPSLLRPLLPFPEGSYSPSWVEWSIIAGILAMAILFYVIFLKIFPILDLSEE